MHFRFCWSAALILVIATECCAQTSWQFRWQKGQVLTYQVKHHTDVTEIVGKEKALSASKLDLTKRWNVTDVDGQGTATIELSLTAMRNEQKRTNGEVLLFDSQDLAKSTPELREQMMKYVGKTAAILRVDRFGRVIEAKQGSADRYESEPAFVLVFPDAKPEAGQTWRRPFNIVLSPPHGTGEKFQAEQVYQCKKIDGGKAYLSVATQIKTPTDNMSQRLPLLQSEMQGEVVFDIASSRLLSSQMSLDKTVENHEGKGSSCRVQSQYTETLVE